MQEVKLDFVQGFADYLASNLQAPPWEGLGGQISNSPKWGNGEKGE